VLERPPVELHRRNDRRNPVGCDGRRTGSIGDVGRDLHADPEAGGTRKHEAVQSQVEYVLHVAGEEDRHQGVVEGDGRVAGQRRRFAAGVIAAQREYAAVAAGARVVGVLERVAGAVYTGAFAVPHAEHAVVFRTGKDARHLASEDRRCTQLLVQARLMNDAVLPQQLLGAGELGVEAAERRAAIAGNKGGGIQSTALVGAMLVQRQPYERLDAGEVDRPILARVLVVEGETVRKDLQRDGCHAGLLGQRKKARLAVNSGPAV